MGWGPPRAVPAVPTLSPLCPHIVPMLSLLPPPHLLVPPPPHTLCNPTVSESARETQLSSSLGSLGGDIGVTDRGQLCGANGAGRALWGWGGGALSGDSGVGLSVWGHWCGARDWGHWVWGHRCGDSEWGLQCGVISVGSSVWGHRVGC